jgi:hypothetical protein
VKTTVQVIPAGGKRTIPANEMKSGDYGRIVGPTYSSLTGFIVLKTDDHKLVLLDHDSYPGGSLGSAETWTVEPLKAGDQIITTVRE